MNIMKAALGTVLVAAALVGGASTASASESASADGAPAYQVRAWHDVNVRTCSSTWCGIGGQLLAGDIAPAYCYVTGEPVSDLGITNDVWVKIGERADTDLFVSAVYLSGNRYANLPVGALC